MSLIKEDLAQELSSLTIKKITSGGSAGNTIATLAQLKNNCYFIGKVANDNFGKKYIEEIEKTSTKFINKNFSDSLSAQSFILVTEDGQRTMATFLGCASEIREEDINENIFQDAEILYLEGYLWDEPKTILALKKAINLAKKHNVKIAFTLSDSFCVQRHKKDFLKLIQNDLDILFANEDEIEALVEEKFSLENLNNFFQKHKNLTAAITRSDKGCAIFQNNNHIAVPGEKIIKIFDATGAGDAFAAGFLHGTINNFSLEESAKLANSLGAKIIQKFGARFDEGEI
jgi:fructokinase